MVSALEIGIRMRNMLNSLTRECYRFACCHPCLVCFLGFLIILCRRFPFLASILIYMSPVLICTGVLLGTLLFFGQFNSAEVQKEKKFTDNISSFQKGFSESEAVIFRRNEYKSITEEMSIEVKSLVKDKVNTDDHKDGLLSLKVPVVDKNSLNVQLEKQVKEEMEREVHEEKLKAQGGPRNDEAIQGEEEGESSELGSDDIESSSPDASMTDIIPVLDELHPLLDMEGPQTTHSSLGSSVIEYEKSHDGSVESDEGTEIPDYEEDEAEESGIDDESKSAIRWTEDDQKSLMDLGSLELERNQRLENIIARRRAWRQMTEKNLIDLESTEVNSNVLSIVTRRNPFDLPDDSYDDSGLPPIPGSAPSILHLRKNPFDTPFDPNEEQSVPKGETPKEEFPLFNQKDTFFRRHESFSLGPSVLRMTKHEREDIYWKPVFESVQMASEGTSYSSFLMQQSDVSDSKLSSVPETESVSSTEQEERMSSEQDLTQDAESISTIDHASGRVESGSQSSGEVDSPEIMSATQSNVYREEVEIVLGGEENNSEIELCYETGEAAIQEEFNIGETHLRSEVVDEEKSSNSSRSSLSEVIDDDVPDVNLEKSASAQQEEKSHIQEFQNEVEEHQHKEPVYDSSPPAARKLQSFYSIYFDSATDLLERTLPRASLEKSANVTKEKSELHDQRENDDTCDHAEDHSASFQPHMEQGDEEIHKHWNKKAGSTTSNYQHVQSEEKPPSDMEFNLSNSDKSFAAAASTNDHNENQDVGTSNNGAGDFYDAMNKFDRSISSLTDDSFASPEFKSPAGGSPKDIKRAEVEQGIPVLAVRSAEDSDLAFKQLQEGADVGEVILPSMIKDQLAREKSEGDPEADSNLKVIEARSLDDVNVALEITSDADEGKLSKSSDLKDGMVKGESNEVEECIDVESSNHEINRIPVDRSDIVPKSTSTSNNEATTQSSTSSSSSGDSD